MCVSVVNYDLVLADAVANAMQLNKAMDAGALVLHQSAYSPLQVCPVGPESHAHNASCVPCVFVIIGCHECLAS